MTALRQPTVGSEDAAPARPRLRPVTRPARTVSTVTFAWLMIGLVVAGMVGLLVLNTQLQSQAFEVRDAQRQASELGYRVSDLEAQVNRVSSPATLGQRASGLGMVPNTRGVFIDLASGRIIGDPKPVTGSEMPSLNAVPAPADVPAAGEAKAAAPQAPASTAPAPATTGGTP